ncbi:MAG TPA: hypothetical protein ENJ79_01915 [Gammaproteobacteria bacterium]|nr:hypothetical protein [Gammaproteobacteria bacterium]
MFFDDGDEHIDRNGDPDLSLDCVWGSIKERFIAQVLLDPFEEQCHLPAITLKLGDGDRRNVEVVGQKDQPLVGIGIVILDPP